MKKRTGYFITFEGGEGSGKSSQIRLLAESLMECGHEVITTREPGGTREAERIRELLVQRDGGNWSETAECLLFFAARNMHVRDLIAPAIADGKIVICDRFTDSTRAYQSYGHGFPLSTLEAIKLAAIGEFEPDLTLILDIDPRSGIERSNRRNSGDSQGQGGKTEDRFERLEISFHQRLRDGYLDISKNNPERCVVIDASRSIEELHEEIKRIVLARICS